MQNIIKILTFLWNAYFFSHRDIEQNQKARSRKKTPRNPKKKASQVLRQSKKPEVTKVNPVIVIGLLISIPIFFILMGSLLIQKYEDVPGIAIVFLIFLATAGIIPCFIVQKIFYPNDK